MLGIEGERLPRAVAKLRAAAFLLLAGMPGGEAEGVVEIALAGERLGRLVRRAAAAEVPPVGPVAAKERQPLLRLAAQPVEEVGKRDEAEPHRRIGGIEAADEI